MSPRVRQGRRAARQSEMSAVAAKFESSGLPQAEFCRVHGIPLSTFTYWRRRLRMSPSSSPPFLQVEVVGDGSGFPIEVSLPGGLIARIGADASEEMIRRLVRAAGQPC